MQGMGDEFFSSACLACDECCSEMWGHPPYGGENIHDQWATTNDTLQLESVDHLLVELRRKPSGSVFIDQRKYSVTKCSDIKRFGQVVCRSLADRFDRGFG